MATNPKHQLDKADHDPIMRALYEGHRSIRATGNIFDLQWDSQNNRVVYRPYYVAERLFEKGYNVGRYSRSSGFTVYREKDVKNPGELNNMLRKYGLIEFKGRKEISPTEVIDFFRCISRLLPTEQETPFALILDYFDNLCGCASSVEEMIIIETVNNITCLPKFSNSGNCVIAFDTKNNNLSPLLKNMHQVDYGYPTLEEYQATIEYLGTKKDYAKIDLKSFDLAKVCCGLTLSQTGGILKAAKANEQTVTRSLINNEKKGLIEQMSEGTLTVLDADLTFDDLAGDDVQTVEMKRIAESLKRGDKWAPRTILLVGRPGNGKTTRVQAMANAAEYTLLKLSDSIKSPYVGESERHLHIALKITEAMGPAILMIDEIDQSFSNRTSTCHDGGVASHYLKTLFEFSAREDIRGKIVIIACSNTPQMLDPALIDRFGVTIPFFEATPDDMVQIFPKIEKRINNGKVNLSPNSKLLHQACEILFSRGASPRQIFDIIARTKLVYGPNYTDAYILETCQHYRGNSDPVSMAYCSLSAIKLTAFSDYFPWIKSPQTYPYPWYLEDIVDRSTGAINELALNKKLDEFSRKSKF